MEHQQALKIASDLVELFTPYCERVAIAGSVRRQKPEVKDLEIVAVPHMIPEQIGMFTGLDFPDEPSPLVSALDDALIGLGRFIKNGQRYKQIVLNDGINLDLFLVLPPAQWGVLYTIRTGPSDFSKWIVTPRKYSGALPSDSSVKDGAVHHNGKIILMPEEIDFLNFLELGWIEPKDRVVGRLRVT
jgi:DNA polymerase/3'-5' exonuclease PolX